MSNSTTTNKISSASARAALCMTREARSRTVTDCQTAWIQTCQVLALETPDEAFWLLHSSTTTTMFTSAKWRQRAKSASRMGHHCHNQATIGEIPAKPPALGRAWRLAHFKGSRAEWGLRLLKSWTGRAWACRAASHPASPFQALGWHSHPNDQMKETSQPTKKERKKDTYRGGEQGR